MKGFLRILEGGRVDIGYDELVASGSGKRMSNGIANSCSSAVRSVQYKTMLAATTCASDECNAGEVHLEGLCETGWDRTNVTTGCRYLAIIGCSADKRQREPTRSYM